MSYEPDPEEEKEAERVQWRQWLLRQEHRLEVENWLRERLLTERKFIFQQVAKAFDLTTGERGEKIQELRDEIGELRAELNGRRAAEKADISLSQQRARQTLPLGFLRRLGRNLLHVLRVQL